MVADALVEHLEGKEIGAVEQIIPAEQGAQRIENDRNAQPHSASPLQRKKIGKDEERKKFDRRYSGVMESLSDVRWIESEHKAADHSACRAVCEMTYKVKRPHAGQGEGGKQRDVLECEQRAEVSAEYPAQFHDCKDLRPGKRLIDQRRALGEPQQVR